MSEENSKRDSRSCESIRSIFESIAHDFRSAANLSDPVSLYWLEYDSDKRRKANHEFKHLIKSPISTIQALIGHRIENASSEREIYRQRHATLFFHGNCQAFQRHRRIAASAGSREHPLFESGFIPWLITPNYPAFRWVSLVVKAAVDHSDILPEFRPQTWSRSTNVPLSIVDDVRRFILQKREYEVIPDPPDFFVEIDDLMYASQRIAEWLANHAVVEKAVEPPISHSEVGRPPRSEKEKMLQLARDRKIVEGWNQAKLEKTKPTRAEYCARIGEDYTIEMLKAAQRNVRESQNLGK